MALRTVDWLLSQLPKRRDKPPTSQPLQIVFDHATDYELLMRLLRDSDEWCLIPCALLQPLNARELIGRFGPGLAYDSAFGALQARGLERHHALADALALRAALHPLLTPRGVAK